MYNLLMKKFKEFANESEATKEVEKYFKKGLLTLEELKNLNEEIDFYFIQQYIQD